VFTINFTPDHRRVHYGNEEISFAVFLNGNIDVRRPGASMHIEPPGRNMSLDDISRSIANVPPNLCVPAFQMLNNYFNLTQVGHYTVHLRRNFDEDPSDGKTQLDPKKVKNYIETTTEFIIEKP
jgi:hypothetical protein